MVAESEIVHPPVEEKNYSEYPYLERDHKLGPLMPGTMRQPCRSRATHLPAFLGQ